ncbi:MAG: low molecular weight phosphotyrosine protein phosphatase [Muribaculaceae bacterium]|nr:low molecular weight phosphotyrosine protein phosphatase [Muribaculaceae bacterium]
MANSLNDKYKILFVCLGNICRSPAAQAIMQKYIDERGLQNKFEIDSAGLYGGHAGELPDKRMRVHARQRGYVLEHRSRPVTESDFNEFNLIVAMDDSNYSRLKSLAPTVEDEEKVVRMIDYVKNFPQFHSVPDPYYEGAEGFEIVLDLLEEGCSSLLSSLNKNQGEKV